MSPRRDTASGGTRARALLRKALGTPRLPAAARKLLEQALATLPSAEGGADADAAPARIDFDALFHALPDPVVVLSAGRVRALNPAAANALGCPAADALGQPIASLAPALRCDPARTASPTAEDAPHLRVVWLHSDDENPLEVHCMPYPAAGPDGMLAIGRDIARRRDPGPRYRELIDLVDQGIVIRDAQARIVYANAAAMRLFDVTPDQVGTQALNPERWMVVDEHGRELMASELPAMRALRTGQGVHGMVLGFFQRQHSRLLWMAVTAIPQRDPDTGRIQQVLSLYSDVTERKRDSQLFERAQSLAHIGGWEWETGEDHLYLTDEARRILGHEAQVDTMEALLACLREADRRRLRAALQEAIEQSRYLDLDLQGMRDDGHAFWIRMLGAPSASAPLRSRLAGTLQDITERKQAEETSRVQARTDPLTSLLNRDVALHELQQRLADHTQRSVGVLYLDLDRFKIVNDMLGHAAGDQLLADAADRIQRAVGSEGLIARFGGDEFLVICNTGDDPDRPGRLADALLDAFRPAFELDGRQFAITASIGVAEAPRDGASALALIRSADAAMFDSKRRGRAGWQPFTEELAEQQRRRLQLEDHLRRAIDNGEFRLVYQPQVDLATGEVAAVEALIRWRNQTLGEIRPDHFIGHAETTGEIIGIGGWVLREACRQMRAWLDRGVGIKRVAVNVSYRQFTGEDLAASVRAALLENGLPGSALELEITERALIEDVPDTLQTFDALRDLGVTLSIDDFGEGYSALQYLRRLPIHGLKLSQLFVRDVPDSPSDVAVCEAVAGIGRGLGLVLVAEGIENERQRDFLRGLGIHIGQGYLFAPGLDADEIERRYGHRPAALTSSQ